MLKKTWRNKGEWSGYFLVVAALHIIGMIGLLTTAADNPAFWGLGLLAYSFGLRHAFDIDHIAAIDNTVRKLIQQNRNPSGVGFFFSLGHSTVVFLMVLAIAFSVRWIQQKMPELQQIGGVIGTTVSGAFLVAIGLINLAVLINLYHIFRKLKNGQTGNEELEKLLDSRGFFSRFMKPLFKLIGRSWHVYPLGFLFGLGFDTATEVGLLTMSATAAKSTIPLFGIISLPVLFAAGMSLLDTADGIFMTTAYRWAFSTPLRKIYYNFTVTLMSVIAALFIGTIELIQVLGEKLNWHASVLQWIEQLDFADLGMMLAAFFVLAWGVSVAAWKAMKIEERLSA